MHVRSVVLAALLAGASLLASGCTSADKKAAAAASIAEGALNDGNPGLARLYAQRALAIRDDVSDYWLLLAHADVAANDLQGAFDAYENLLTLDRSNVEALTTLSQLGLAGHVAIRAEKFADQLALVQPTSPLPPTVKAAAALERGDKPTAYQLLEKVLQAHPDDLGALIVRSRLLASDERYAEAAELLEKTLQQGGNPLSRLNELKETYRKAGNREGYKRTMGRLVQADPKDMQRQLDYAALLFDDGERQPGYAVTRRVLNARPADVATASTILNLWMRQGAGALPVASMARDAESASLEGKATYAQYLNEAGRPDLALAVLGSEASPGRPDAANSDAKAAFAYATALRGDPGGAMTMLNAILSVDPHQPRALLARARLRADTRAAIEDARQVVSDDQENVAARLTLADLLIRQREAVLAESVLREGMRVDGGDPRVARRLARFLADDGREADAKAVLADFARADPLKARPGAAL